MTIHTAKPANSVNQHVEAYAEGLRLRGYSPKTIAIYTHAVWLLTNFLGGNGEMDLQSVSKDHLTRFRLDLLERDYQAASIEIFLRGLKSFFRYLEEGQHLFINPAEDLVVMQAKRRLLPVPSEEDMQLLMQQPDTSTPLGLRNRAILETAYGTGARLGELTGLKVDDLNLEEQTVKLLGKGRRERVVPLGTSATRWIQRYLKEARPALLGPEASDALWINSRRQPLGYQSAGIMIRGYGRAAGLAEIITTHSLRRACATHMLRRGADPVSIQQLLGHAGLKHLSQYLRVTITEIKAMHEDSIPGQ